MKTITVENNDVLSVLKQIRFDHKEKGTFLRLKKFHRFRKTAAEKAREKKLDAIKRKISEIKSIKRKRNIKNIITDFLIKDKLFNIFAYKDSSKYTVECKTKKCHLIESKNI